MKIGIASDHRGYKKKSKIIKYLRSRNYGVVDLGTDNEERVNYTDYAKKVCEGIISKKIDYGILICWTGTGMSIYSNKYKGIYCGKVDSIREAKLGRSHNNINVIAISSMKPTFIVNKMIEAFLHTPFGDDPKYQERLNEIKELEK